MGRTRFQGYMSEDSPLFFATVIHNNLRWKSTHLCHVLHRSSENKDVGTKEMKVKFYYISLIFDFIST